MNHVNDFDEEGGGAGGGVEDLDEGFVGEMVRFSPGSSVRGGNRRGLSADFAEGRRFSEPSAFPSAEICEICG